MRKLGFIQNWELKWVYLENVGLCGCLSVPCELRRKTMGFYVFLPFQDRISMELDRNSQKEHMARNRF